MAAEDWPGQIVEGAPSGDEEYPGAYTGDQKLAGLRASYADELRDPQIASGLYNLTHNEVGKQGPDAARAFVESVFNRAAARGTTLAHTISDRSYYPRVSFHQARLKGDDVNRYDQVVSDVVSGSNDTNYATGNASGSVGFAGGPQTHSVGGERFGIEGPDINWPKARGVIPEISTKNIPQYGEDKWPGEIVDGGKESAQSAGEPDWPGEIVEQKPEDKAAAATPKLPGDEQLSSLAGTPYVEGVSEARKALPKEAPSLWHDTLDYFDLNKQAQPPEKQSIGAKILEQAGQKLESFIPRSVLDVAGYLTPAVGAVQELIRGGSELPKQWENVKAGVEGKTLPHPELAPKTYDKFTKDDWVKFGVNVGTDALMAGLGFKGLKAAVAEPRPVAPAAAPETAPVAPAEAATPVAAGVSPASETAAAVPTEALPEAAPVTTAHETVAAPEAAAPVEAEVSAAAPAAPVTATSGPLESGESPVETPVEPGTILDKVSSGVRGILSLLEPEAPPTAPAGFMAQPGPVGPLARVAGKVRGAYQEARSIFGMKPIRNLQAEGLGDAAYQHASARTSVVHTVKELLSRVFPDQYKDPALMKKTGDILVKDNILGVYDEAVARGEDKAAAKIADKVDLAKYDADVRAAAEDPKIADNIQRWRKWVNPEMDTMYNELQAVDPAMDREPRGRHFKARINLLPLDRAKEMAQFSDPNEPMPQMSGSSYRNPNVRRDQFARRAKGTGQYSTDPSEILTNTIGGRWNEVTKLRLYNEIQRQKAGVITEAGERPGPEWEGQDLVRLAIKVPETSPTTGRVRPVEKALYVKRPLAREVRQVLATDQAIPNNPILKGLTGLQIATGLTDLTAHLKNIHTVVANSLGASKGWQDALRRFPFLSSVDTVGRIGSVVREVAKDTPAMRAEKAEMARNGLLRPDYRGKQIPVIGIGSRLIHHVDTAARIVMNRFWDNLVERGYVKDSLSARRTFVNQIGEYNSRVMPALMKAFRDTGVSPFIVAGRTFNRFSKRLLTGEPGFKAVSPKAAAMARAYQLSTLASATLIPAIINYFTTGQFGGRPGTPLGAIDTGSDNDKGQRRLVDLFHLLGIRRGLRATGASAVIEGVRAGDTPGRIAGQAVEDITTTMMHPWIGPGVGGAYAALTGKRLDLRSGPTQYLARQIPGGGIEQYKENLRVSLKNQNPTLYSLIAPTLGGDPEDSQGELAKSGFLKAPLQATGYKEQTIRTPAEDVAHDAIQASFGGAPTEAMVKRGKVCSDIVRKLRDNDPEAYSAIREALGTGDLTKKDLKGLRTRARLSPLQVQVKMLPMEKALPVWQAANPEERQKILPILLKKIRRARNLSPADKVDYRKALFSATNSNGSGIQLTGQPNRVLQPGAGTRAIIQWMKENAQDPDAAGLQRAVRPRINPDYVA